jgi:hypothetical protein
MSSIKNPIQFQFSSNKMIATLLVTVIALSGCLIFSLFENTQTAYGHYYDLGVQLTPEGTIKLGVNQPQTFTATVSGGMYPYTFTWISQVHYADNTTGQSVEFKRETFSQDWAEKYFDGEKPVSTWTFDGFPEASMDYFTVTVEVTDASGAKQGEMCYVFDPYTSVTQYLNGANAADWDYKIETDGLGWYRAVKGDDLSICWTSTNYDLIFQQSVNASDNGKVVLGAGNFYSWNMRVYQRNNITITGMGQGVTNIYQQSNYDSASSPNFFDIYNSSTISVSDLSLYGFHNETRVTRVTAILVNNTPHCTIKNTEIAYFDGRGISSWSDGAFDLENPDSAILETTDLLIDGNNIHDMYNVLASNIYGYGINVVKADRATITNNFIVNSADSAIRTDRALNVIITNNQIKGTNNIVTSPFGDVLDIYATSHAKIIGNNGKDQTSGLRIYEYSQDIEAIGNTILSVAGASSFGIIPVNSSAWVKNILISDSYFVDDISIAGTPSLITNITFRGCTFESRLNFYSALSTRPQTNSGFITIDNCKLKTQSSNILYDFNISVTNNDIYGRIVTQYSPWVKIQCNNFFGSNITSLGAIGINGNHTYVQISDNYIDNYHAQAILITTVTPATNLILIDNNKILNTPNAANLDAIYMNANVSITANIYGNYIGNTDFQRYSINAKANLGGVICNNIVTKTIYAETITIQNNWLNNTLVP